MVAAITNLLFYDVPSNLLFQEENKLLGALLGLENGPKTCPFDGFCVDFHGFRPILSRVAA